MAAKQLRKLVPFFDRVLVQKFVPETTTKAGIMIPENSANKLNQGVVIAVGGGSRLNDGTVAPISVKIGDMVMLPEFGGTKVLINDKDFYLYREHEILGKLE